MSDSVILEQGGGERRAEPLGKRKERALNGEARKADYTANLRHAAGPVLMVAAADKVHNAGAIVRDVAALGPDVVFGRFVGRRDGTVWYYREVLASLQARVAAETRV